VVHGRQQYEPSVVTGVVGSVETHVGFGSDGGPGRGARHRHARADEHPS
jgi:hypothetical protein